MSNLIPAVAYYRMSSDKQEASIEDQQTAVTQYAADNGYRILRDYRDEAISGWKSEERKGFQKLIADATDRGDFRAVLCWDQDRFSRFDPLEANHYWYLLDQAGVRLATVGQGVIDWHSLGGWLSASITQHGKAEYVRDLARNTTRGLRRRKLAGGWIGGVPVGYRLQAGRLVFGEPDEVALVRRIFDLRTKGYGVSNIAEQLNHEGIASPKGKAWCARSVRHILDRDTYVGDSIVGKHSRGRYEQVAKEITTIADTHPAIIDRATWAAVQRMPRMKRRANGRCGGEGAALSGLLKCGCCGEPMYAKTINNWDSYLCSGYQHKNKCGCCHVQRVPLLRAVATKLREVVLMGSQERLEAAIQRQLDQRREHAPDDSGTRRKIATLDRQIERAAGRLLTVDDSLVGDVQTQLLALKEQRAKLADPLEAKSAAPQQSAKAIAAKMWELDRILTTAPATTVRHVLSQVIDHIRLDFHEVAPTRRGRRYEFTGGVMHLLSQEGQQGTVPPG